VTDPKLLELELKKCCCESRQAKLIPSQVVPDGFICLFGRHYYGYNFDRFQESLCYEDMVVSSD